MRGIIIAAVIFLHTSNNFAQTTTDKIGQLVSNENYFAALVKEKGIKKAFLQVSDQHTLLFKPSPVKAADFFRRKTEDYQGVLSWQPTYARISKSDDWGFTTGPYTFRNEYRDQPFFGEYLSIWKKNHKGIWKLALDIGTPHKKPPAAPKLLFVNPLHDKFLHQKSRNRLEQRKDIVLSSDRLYATVLKANNLIAFDEFLTDDARLLFPGEEPIIGKEAIIRFWQKQNVKLTAEPTEADRAYSGELAYTHGRAAIKKGRESKAYHYVRVWEVQPGFKWNVILEAFTAEEKQ